MSEDAAVIFHLVGWLLVAIVAVEGDIRRGELFTHGCNWPLVPIIGWMWPAFVGVYILIYLPALALSKVLK